MVIDNYSSVSELYVESQEKLRGDARWCPDYIGLGAMKSASTWLNQCLIEHPEILSASRKEVHFFDSAASFEKGINHYKQFFPDNCGHIIGENTPSYLFDVDVPERIKKYFPGVKLLVCLRDPAERAWSHYQYGLQMKGRLSRYKDFAAAVRADRSLVENGRYGEQLSRYFRLFPKENIKIVFYEELKENPLATVQGVYRFLGVTNTEYEPDAVFKKRNETGDRGVSLKYENLWNLLLFCRSLVHRAPFLENILRRSGVISRVKGAARRGAVVERMTGISERKVMTKEDRRLVVDELIEDINVLEAMLNVNLEKWKTW